jgi:flavin reductase (DIM6/NTAB) family NADH-FMN oxidoreductase RutF
VVDLESLFKLNYGMCIVCLKRNNKFNGCIVNTVFQITPEPPMVAVSINRQCLTHEYIADSKLFTVSILSQEAPLSFVRGFGFRSGRDIYEFKGINYKIGRTGVPIILDNTATFFEAKVTESIDVITHTLFIAKIVACETPDEDAEPMTYDYYRDIKHGRTPKNRCNIYQSKTKGEVERRSKKYEEI